MPSAKRLKATLWLILNSPILWLILACIPALIIFANRVLIPDYSTDVLSYHLFNGLRAWQHPIVAFSPSEFYPVGIANISAFYDALTYVWRSLLGYRLGTSLSLASSIGCIWILYLLMRRILSEQSKKFHAGWGLLLVNAAIVLELQFQLATYFIDIINAFVVLVVFYFALRLVTDKKKSLTKFSVWAMIWFALGFLLAVKLTNLAFVIPLTMLLIRPVWLSRRKFGYQKILKLSVLMLVGVLPLLPGWIANYKLSHNPVFPFYNTIFQSPYYAKISYTDTTFGGTNLLAKLLWPVFSLSNQLRLGEPHHIYNDYKLIIYWLLVVFLVCLWWMRRIKLGSTAKIILLYFLGSVLFWGLLFGIERYLISSMLLGGLSLVIILASLDTIKVSWLKQVVKLLAWLVIVILAIENYRIMHFNLRYDISWRPPLYSNKKLHRQQLHYLFAKNISLDAASQTEVNHADLMLNCDTDVVGLLSLLPNASNKPVVNIIAANLPQYADMSQDPDYIQQRLIRLHNQLPSKRTYRWVSITSSKDIGPTNLNCQKNITDNHGTILGQHIINSFLGNRKLQLTLINGEISF